MRQFATLTVLCLLATALPATAEAHRGHHGWSEPRIIYISRDNDDGRYHHQRRHHQNENEDDDDNGRGHGRDVIVLERSPDVSIRFGDHDHSLIIGWFNNRPSSRVYHLSNLPPGIERQIRRRGHIPPGLVMHALPAELAYRLGPAPRGYERIVIGSDIVLIEMERGTIADIIRNVL